MIKYLFLSILSFTVLNAEFSKSRDDGIEVKLKTILKGSHKSAIKNFDFFKNQKLLSSSKKTLKIWDIKEQELLKSIELNSEIKKSLFSKDGNKIFVLTQKEFFIFDANKYKKIDSLKVERNYFSEFNINSDESRLILATWGNGIKTYNLKTSKELYSITSSKHIKEIVLSPNQKYFALRDNYNNVKIFNMNSGEYISKLPKSNTLKDIEFSDNKLISQVISNKVLVYNHKTSELEYTLNSYKKRYFTSFYKLKKIENALIVSEGYDYIRLADLSTNKFIKKVKIDSFKTVYNGLKTSFDNSLLVVGFKNGNFKLYNTKGFLEYDEKPIIKEKEIKVESKPIVIYKEKIIEKVITKENKPASLILEASSLEGIVPLKVDITIIANDDKGIDSYYINLAGKESMSKGTPPTTISKTFNTAGTYKVIVVVKDTDGEITKKSLTIKPREQTFSDYKKMYQ